MKEYDVVNAPKHYNREGAIECFDEFLMLFGEEAAMHACLFNIWKYRYRAADKNGEEDLRKSDWYARKYRELKNGVVFIDKTPTYTTEEALEIAGLSGGNH